MINLKKRIIAASLAVIIATSFFACSIQNDNVATQSDAPAISSDAVTATPLETEVETETTTETTTSIPSTTKEPTTVATTAKQVLTTVKKVTTTRKPTTTKKSAPKTTQAETETTAEELTGRYYTAEETRNEELKYGVVARRVYKIYYVYNSDGTKEIIREELDTDYYDRHFYIATYSDLLPAAKENRETYRDEIREVLRIINGFRAEGGLAPLKLNEELTVIANVRAEELAWSGVHSHTRPNLQSCFSLMRENGFETGMAGENIGWGYSTPEAVCEAWKNSETHYKNIMDPQFTEVGIGVSADPKPSGKLCWSNYFYG